MSFEKRYLEVLRNEHYLRYFSKANVQNYSIIKTVLNNLSKDELTFFGNLAIKKLREDNERIQNEINEKYASEKDDDSKIARRFPNLEFQKRCLSDMECEIDDLTRTLARIMIRKKIAMARLLRDALLRIISKSKSLLKMDCEFCKKTQKLQDVFGLSDVEKRILVFLFLFPEDHFEDDFSSSHFDKNIKEISEFIGLTEDQILKAVGNGPTLRNYFLADNEGRYTQKSVYENVELIPLVKDYLSGGSGKDFEERFFKVVSGEVIPFEKHNLTSVEKETLLSLISSSQKRRNILFYGEPGTGKTELAKTLGSVTNKKVYFINDFPNESEQSKERIMALKACLNCIDLANSIIVVDEADSILNTIASHLFRGENIEKSSINLLLEEHNATIIWIINNSGLIESSVKRRFKYSLEFKKLNLAQRIFTWESILKKMNFYDLISEKERRELARDYQVNPAGIVLSLEEITRNDLETNKEKSLTLVRSLLKRHMGLVFRVDEIKNNKNANGYSLEGLKMSEDPLAIIKRIERFINLEPEKMIFKNHNMVFAGPPGTGKTEFVKYLSDSLDIPFLQKKGSDLLSKYVGDNEKMIKASFEEAQEEKAILFIDEADTFLFSREQSEKNWESSMVNEFLFHMENFEGILVCATNRIKEFDNAVIRRFSEVIKFDYLDDEGKVLFYKKLLTPLTRNEISDEFLKKKLSVLENMTPGDFKVACQKHYLKDLTTHEELLLTLTDVLNNKTEVPKKVRL